MMKSVIRLGAFCAVLVSVPAMASTVVWKDPVYAFTMSYPDSWTIQTDDTPDTRLRIAGPLGDDLATCRMKVAEDGRLKIYPKTYVDEAVQKIFTRDYWQGEANQYEGAQVTDYYSPASLGNRGDATAVKVSFMLDDGRAKVPMQGFMLGGIYGDKRFIASCASKKEVYARWVPVFMSILDSIELDARYHPFVTGYYRDFLLDPKLQLPRSKPGTENPKEGNIFTRIFADKYHQ